MAEYGYARVSTSEQREQLQVDALIGAGVPAENITVEHVSGTATTRPGLTAVLDGLGEGDRLTVWRFDRVFRSTRHLLELTDELRGRGVEFRSLRDNIDTSTASGRFFFTITAAVATLEADLVRERTAAGLAAARARGIRLGRPASASPEQVALIRQLAAQGMPQTTIAASVGMSRSAVGRVLRSELKSVQGIEETEGVGA